jgi:hypothetical protein
VYLPNNMNIGIIFPPFFSQIFRVHLVFPLASTPLTLVTLGTSDQLFPQTIEPYYDTTT